MESSTVQRSGIPAMRWIPAGDGIPADSSTFHRSRWNRWNSSLSVPACPLLEIHHVQVRWNSRTTTAFPAHDVFQRVPAVYGGIPASELWLNRASMLAGPAEVRQLRAD